SQATMPRAKQELYEVGYDSSEDSWQPEENFANGPMLSSFWRNVNMKKRKDVYPGTEVHASAHWINQQRKISALRRKIEGLERDLHVNKGLHARESRSSSVSSLTRSSPERSTGSDTEYSSSDQASDSDSRQWSPPIMENPDEEQGRLSIRLPAPPQSVEQDERGSEPHLTENEPMPILPVYGSILPTKQRLSFGALETWTPKDFYSNINAHPMVIRPESSLPYARTSLHPLSLGFKKNAAPPITLPGNETYISFLPPQNEDPELTLTSINSAPSPDMANFQDSESSDDDENAPFVEEWIPSEIVPELPEESSIELEELLMDSETVESSTLDDLETPSSTRLIAKTSEASKLSNSHVIFIHVDAIKHLHNFRGFQESISSSLSVFFAFGSHLSASGPREIYPCGGIVTFTAEALEQEPWQVCKQIRYINGHPLWGCYILPSALGLAIQLHALQKRSNIFEDLERQVFIFGKFLFIKVLKAIEDGEVALITSPHESASSGPDKDWIEKYWLCRPRGLRQTLETCLKAFAERFSDLPKAEWNALSRKDVSEDLRCMRSQPVLMNAYRRYVVLDSSVTMGARRKQQRVDEPYYQLEWVSTEKFNFGDDFYEE
ncbi:hypothetical protein H0H93_014345, partial [Arthromyces matolae]